jgi:hypothetical protein
MRQPGRRVIVTVESAIDGAAALARRGAAGFGMCAAAAVIALLLSGCGAGTAGAASASVLAAGVTSGSEAAIAAGDAGEPPCGAAGAETAARAVALSASRIYTLELQSREVRADLREVAGYAPLLKAVAAGDHPAIEKAVTQLVYSHTHIVRLRVERSGKLLYDLGGAHSIAPVGGRLALHGRTIGSFLLSVQDDVGYVKLETRYVGAPMLLREGAKAVPVEGMIHAGTLAIPARGPVEYRGRRYQAVSFAAAGFPHARLRVTLLVAVPPAAMSCRAITLFELGRTAATIWRRFLAVSAPASAFVKTAASLTGALTFVREGSRELAASNGPGPPSLPLSGTVSYRGVVYDVTSFAAGTRTIYLLLAE